MPVHTPYRHRDARTGKAHRLAQAKEVGRTAENIRHNRTGSLFCFDKDKHESIALKGYLFVEELVEYKKLAAQLNEFQKDLNYEHPVIAVFETLSVKHYENMHGEFLDVPEQ